MCTGNPRLKDGSTLVHLSLGFWIFSRYYLLVQCPVLLNYNSHKEGCSRLFWLMTFSTEQYVHWDTALL